MNPDDIIASAISAQSHWELPSNPELQQVADYIRTLSAAAQHMVDFQFAELLREHGGIEEPLNEFCRRKRALRNALAAKATAA